MAERRSGSSRRSGGPASAKPAAKSRRSAPASGGLSAADAVARARAGLSELIGRPVEAVLGIDRDHGNWVAVVQVVELARIPNTTDVLGEYETVLDGRGEIVRYQRKRRYHRGQVDGSQS